MSNAKGMESAVQERYGEGARQAQTALCCAVGYDPDLLKALPEEILEKDYGCGDPSRYVRPGDTVLDLGSGGGKVCYIASQIVGHAGRVIGVDFNEEMLALARRHLGTVAGRIGYGNVEFRRGRIQDLALDLDRPDAAEPMIASDSIDVVISNCVLNLVTLSDRKSLFTGMFRVLKQGGRAAISDIVSDRPVPDALRQDPDLWSGCISGAFEEGEFLAAFEEAGFREPRIESRAATPHAVVQGIEFRSVTVTAYKGEQQARRCR
jgi:ubiquinone/menaquinone biosynthesis C-methylase UbiE